MSQINIPSFQEENRKERRLWRPLLLLLTLLLLVTSCIAGFILGRSAGPVPLGQIIDTILLTPDTSEADNTAFHLTGRVFYSDGTPAAGRTLELHSDIVVAVSDSQGGFLFANAPQGEHTIYVLDEDGAPAAQREISVVRDSSAKAVSIDLQGSGKYVINLALDVRVLEIAIELDSGTLYIDPVRVTYATTVGTVTTPSGSASILDGVVVSPGGNVYLQDGSIVLPGGADKDPTYIIQPDNTLLINQALSAGENTVAADGTVTLPDDTVIGPGGVITTPGGASETPGATGVIVGEQTVTPIGGAAQPGTSAAPSASPPVPSVKPGAATPPAGPATPGESASQPQPPVTGQPSEQPPTPTPMPLPTQPSVTAQPDEPSASPSSPPDGGGEGSGGGSDKPTPPTPDFDTGELHASTQTADGTYIVWDQYSIIDLFHNQVTGQQGKIAPGSSGYYLFRLENTRKYALAITLSLSEEPNSPFIPLQFTLRPQDRQDTGVSGILLEGGTLTLESVLEGGGDTVYQLDWKWPFDGGADQADTAAGVQGGLYTLKLSIHAEEGGG